MCFKEAESLCAIVCSTCVKAACAEQVWLLKLMSHLSVLAEEKLLYLRRVRASHSCDLKKAGCDVLICSRLSAAETEDRR